jgi:hypothetical protein
MFWIEFAAGVVLAALAVVLGRVILWFVRHRRPTLPGPG